jgi:RNA polymerase sigma-70 factor, ECF subfamily
MNRSSPDTGSSEGAYASSGTSRSLLARVQADESDAWDRLVSLYAPLVLHWCRSGGLQGPDAADIFQQVFQSVVANVGSFRKERAGDTFRGWLRRITQNKVRDHFRRQVREAQAVGGSSAMERLSQLPEPAPAGDDLAAQDRFEQELFARALEMIRNEFEPRTWAAFWQTVVEDRCAGDVGDDLAMSPGAVRVAKSRVLHRLRQELGDLIE